MIDWLQEKWLLVLGLLIVFNILTKIISLFKISDNNEIIYITGAFGPRVYKKGGELWYYIPFFERVAEATHNPKILEHEYPVSFRFKDTSEIKAKVSCLYEVDIKNIYKYFQSGVLDSNDIESDRKKSLKAIADLFQHKFGEINLYQLFNKESKDIDSSLMSKIYSEVSDIMEKMYGIKVENINLVDIETLNSDDSVLLDYNKTQKAIDLKKTIAEKNLKSKAAIEAKEQELLIKKRANVLYSAETETQKDIIKEEAAAKVYAIDQEAKIAIEKQQQALEAETFKSFVTAANDDVNAAIISYIASKSPEAAANIKVVSALKGVDIKMLIGDGDGAAGVARMLEGLKMAGAQPGLTAPIAAIAAGK